MGKETRKIYGRLWKLGKVKGDFEKYYLEFKDEIDQELAGQSFEKEEKEVKAKRK